MRVLVVLPAQEPLRESARAFGAGRPAGVAAESVRRPPAVRVDPDYPAVPIGDARGAAETRSMAPDASANFVVRAEIDDDRLEEVSRDARVFADPRIEPFQTAPQICPGDPPRGTASDVEARLDVAALGEGDLTGDKVAIAIMDTGINMRHLRSKTQNPRLDPSVTWVPRGVQGQPGAFPVDHGTMCAYDALIAAPQATLFDYPILTSQTAGGAPMGGFLSDALQAYAHLLGFWAVAFGPTRSRYNALVVNNSWGMYQLAWDFPSGHPGRYADNLNHPFNIVVGALARSGAEILFAAGNCGMPCPSQRCNGQTSPSIFGANAHPDVLTLAGCDVNDQRVGYSSQGPAIAGMGQDKPDLTAYTHFVGSEAFGANTPDSGTSTACPVAAGCVAALRTALAPANEPPAALFQTLRQTARQIVGRGWNGDYGHGIIDIGAAAQQYGLLGAAPTRAYAGGRGPMGPMDGDV